MTGSTKEKYIERKVYEYAESLGWLQYKFSSPSYRGVPDRIFLRNNRCVFIEFKALGKKPTTLQKWTIRKIQEEGFSVVVIDSVDEGIRFFNILETMHAKH